MPRHLHIPPIPNSEKYGYFNFRPKFMQRFTRPKWAIIILCFGPCIQGVIVNGMMHYFISSIEKLVGLKSTQSGLMTGAYDIASVICMIPVTYYGGQQSAHKPRWIGIGIIIMGLGSIIFSLPAFIVVKDHSRSLLELCTFKTTTEPQVCKSGRLPPVFWLLFLGNLLHGVGASPLFTLAITYMDEGIPATQSSLYIGIYFTMFFIGPAIGYLAGGYLDSLNTDFFVKIYSRSSETEGSSWVGCWWLGFLVSGFLCFILAIPIIGLPQHLNGGKRPTSRKVSHNLRAGMYSKKSSMRTHFPKVIRKLLLNHLFLFISFAGCCEGILIAGIGVFLPKILEFQFGLSSAHRAIFLGTVTLPSATAGIVLGGFLINHYKMGFIQILKLSLFCMTMSLICLSCLLISCPNRNVVGINVPYKSMLNQNGRDISLWDECNAHCGCSETLYMPICGIDGSMYFSPCFAGCAKYKYDNGVKSYYECSCIPGFDEPLKCQAKNVPCPNVCVLFPLFILLVFFYQFFTFCAAIPCIAATLRSVEPEKNKSLAMGVQWILVRVLGTIPGPLIYGSMIDAACLYWHAKCSVRENCILYDQPLLAKNISIVGYVWKTIQVIFFVIALLSAYAKRRTKKGH